MRSTYSSAWRLFVDRPDVLTAGEYRRCDPAAPCYRGLHNIGSRNWRQGSGEPTPLLGEADTAIQRWTGSLDYKRLPLPVVSGDSACIERGEAYGQREPPSQVVGGYPSDCWRRVSAYPPMRLSDIDFTEPGVLLVLATIVQNLYSNPAIAEAQAIAFLGPGTVTTVQNPTGVGAFPTTLIATNGSLTVVFAAGTVNFQQLALQGLYSLIPLPIMAGWGTNPVHAAAAHRIEYRINAAAIPADGDIVLVAHSYGAAALANLAGLYHRVKPERPVALVTFGMPKPGDDRLIAAIRGLPGRHLAAAGDPVPSLPPTLPDALPYWALETIAPLTAWNGYRSPDNRYVIDQDGTMRASQVDTFSILDLTTAVEAALAESPLAPFDAHAIGEYVDRLTPH